MKKLFALVLTLALVFAIAAPAMAAWGAPTAPTGSPFKVVVTKYVEKTSAAGATYLDVYPENLAVVAGTPVIFEAVVTIPKLTDVNTYYNTPGAVGTFDAYLELDNISITSITATKKVGTNDAGALADVTKANLKIDDPGSDKVVYTYTVRGTVTKTAAAAADFVVGYEVFEALPNDGIKRTVGGIEYTITASKITAGTNELTFQTLSNGTVGEWYLKIGETTYTVDAGPTFWKGSPASKVTAPLEIASAKSVYDGFVALLGFKAGDTGIYYSETNILATFGLVSEVKGTAAYKPYTSSLTVTDGTNVPNTGDNMSVIGFVMVGLALLATAAVVVKKVRA